MRNFSFMVVDRSTGEYYIRSMMVPWSGGFGDCLPQFLRWFDGYRDKGVSYDVEATNYRNDVMYKNTFNAVNND